MRSTHLLTTFFCTWLSFTTLAQTDTWTIHTDTIDPAHYAGITVANGMIGLVSSPEPFKAKDIVLNGAFDLYGRGRVSNILKTFNFVNLYLDGRRTRFGKVFGVRLNLDDIEAMVPGAGAVAAVAGEDKIVIFVESGSKADIRQNLARRLKLHWSGFEVRSIDVLPLLSNGKVDYRALESGR